MVSMVAVQVMGPEASFLADVYDLRTLAVLFFWGSWWVCHDGHMAGWGVGNGYSLLRTK